MKRLIPLLLIPAFAFADPNVNVVTGAPVCTTYEALKIASKNELGLKLSPYESIKLANECDSTHEGVVGQIKSTGVYSKVRLPRYDGKMKIYFVNTRDLEEVK